jgi:starch synthase
MKILFVAAECSPFVKVGGLADVIGSLPQALRKRRNVEIRIILPLYRSIPEAFRKDMRQSGRFYIELGARKRVFVGLKTLRRDGLDYVFVDSPEFFRNRKNTYGENDDSLRFTYFQKAAIEALDLIDFQPDIIHVHDWHTAMIPLLLKTKYERHRFVKSVLTIHNLAYQGIFPIQQYLPFNMDFDYRFEFDGFLNFLKAGIVSADVVTTVSPTYAKEILTDYFGYGMQKLLKLRGDSLKGILNGLSYEEFSPQTDRLIAQTYDVESFNEGKRANKEALYRRLDASFEDSSMLIGMVTRLVGQKGLDLVKRVFDEILTYDNVKFVVLGDGDPEYVQFFKDLAVRHEQKMRIVVGYDNQLAHLIYAASDLFLMPSKFEPCGLGQLIALKYGTLPLVRETGGLVDTVKPYNEFDKTGNGFSFSHYNAHDMMHVIRYALSVHQNDPFAWDTLVKRAMQEDFSWHRSAQEYADLYKQLKRKKRD